MGMQNTRTLSHLIYRIRNRRVMLSVDLAALYDVEARALAQAVKRNRDRFPEDFLFQLTTAETRSIRDSGTRPSRGRYSKYRPLAFTEQGVAMLSSVLKSKRAIHANIAIMRAFVKLRELSIESGEIINQLKELKSRVDQHDGEIGALIDAIREGLLTENEDRLKIGFTP